MRNGASRFGRVTLLQSLAAMPGRDIRRKAVSVTVALVVLGIVAACLSAARRTAVDGDSVVMAHALLQAMRDGLPAETPFGGKHPVGYGLLLSLIALVTPGTQAGLACIARGGGDACNGQLVAVIGVQLVAALGALPIAYRIALNLSGRASVAFLTTLLAVLSWRLGEMAGTVRGGIWYLLVLLVFVLLVTETRLRGSVACAAGAGLAGGVAALFEPLCAVVVPVAALQLVAGLSTAGKARTSSVAVLAAGALVISATVAGLSLLSLATGGGYDAMALVRHIGDGIGQRLAFVGLERSSWLAAVVTPVPWIGDLMAGMLPAAEMRKFSVGAVPGSLVLHGSQTIFAEAMSRAGGVGSEAVGSMLRDGVFGQPVAYLASLPPVIARGVFAGGGVIALAGLFHVRQMLAFARAEDRLGVHLAVVAPVVALFAVNVLTTGNGFWLNPMLPFVYAYAIAYVASGW